MRDGVKTGLGKSLDELPIAGAAPEWMSEKAIAIGWHFCGIRGFGCLWHAVSVIWLKEFDQLCHQRSRGNGPVAGGRLRLTYEDGPMMIAHINKRRKALNLRPMMYQ